MYYVRPCFINWPEWCKVKSNLFTKNITTLKNLPVITDVALATILEIISDGIWDWNANTGHVYRSPGWFIMLGYEERSLDNTVFTWESIIHEDDYDRVMEHFERHITHQSDIYKIQYRCLTNSGDYIWIEDRGRVVEWNDDNTVARMIGAHRDIDAEIKLSEHQALENKTLQEMVNIQTTELLSLNKKLMESNIHSERLATTDSLTSLSNRYFFEQKLKSEAARAKRFNEALSLVMFDLDYFKPINDAYGHEKGDLVLIQVAEIVRENTREIDTSVRWGGDEFILLLPNTSLDKAVKVAEKIRQLISDAMVKLNLNVTASFGVAKWNQDEEPSRLIIQADKGLYESKNAGRNMVAVSH